MAGTTYKTAPPSAVPCFICHRYLDPEKLDDRGRCADRAVCPRAVARMVGRAPKLSARAKRALGMR